jgi:hypothetical protein
LQAVHFGLQISPQAQKAAERKVKVCLRIKRSTRIIPDKITGVFGHNGCTPKPLSQTAALNGNTEGEKVMARDPKEMTDEEIHARIVRLGFDGDEGLFSEFCEQLRQGLPPGTGVALRGSVLTNERYEDGQPFDAKGEGTSDLDLTLIGNKVMEYWKEDEFYIPKLHTKPLGDKAPDIAPDLNPLREKVQQLVQRPVNIQATSNLVLFVRDVLLNQPYYLIIEADETS